MTAICGPIRSNDSLLRFAMRADAIGTGVGGVAFAMAAKPLSSHTGLSTTTHQLAGVVFIILGLGGLVLAALPSVRWPGVGMVLANVVATIGVLVIVLADWLPLTNIGLALFLASAIYTTFMGYMQFRGARRLT
jgi:hypothetical protein